MRTLSLHFHSIYFVEASIQITFPSDKLGWHRIVISGKKNCRIPDIRSNIKNFQCNWNSHTFLLILSFMCIVYSTHCTGLKKSLNWKNTFIPVSVQPDTKKSGIPSVTLQRYILDYHIILKKKFKIQNIFFLRIVLHETLCLAIFGSTNMQNKLFI